MQPVTGSRAIVVLVFSRWIVVFVVAVFCFPFCSHLRWTTSSPHFSSGIVDRAKRERVKIIPSEKGETFLTTASRLSRVR